MKVLVEGRPGSGKTTVARRLVALLRDRGVPLVGFTTEEIREGRQRVGFAIETVDGERTVLAHVDFPGSPRVGKYGVDVGALDRLGVPALAVAPGAVAVVDELGKMELASTSFCEAVTALFASATPVAATVQLHRHPFTDELKARAGVELIRVTHTNRDRLPAEIADRVSPRAR